METVISRSKVIPASKSAVFKYISDFSYFHNTDPWSLCDPECKSSYSNPSHGVGAWYEWDGTIIGAGRLEITEIFPDYGGVKFKLDFVRPKSKDNTHKWILEEVQENGKIACKVTNAFVPKYAWFLTPFKAVLAKMMDAMLGQSFELELIRLAHLVNNNEPPADIILQDSVQLEDRHYVGMKFSKVKVTPENLGKICEESYKTLGTLLSEKHLTQLDAFVGYINFKPKTQKSDLLVAIFVDKDASNIINDHDPSVISGKIPAHYFLKYIHKGTYDTLHHAWGTAMMRAKKMQNNACKVIPHLEIYKELPDKDSLVAVTEILVPIVKDLEEKALEH